MKIVYAANRTIYKYLPTAVNSLLLNNKNVEKIYLLIEDKFNKMGRDYQAYIGDKIVVRHYAGITKPWRENASEKDKAFWNKYYTNCIDEKFYN